MLCRDCGALIDEALGLRGGQCRPCQWQHVFRLAVGMAAAEDQTAAAQWPMLAKQGFPYPDAESWAAGRAYIADRTQPRELRIALARAMGIPLDDVPGLTSG